MKYVERERHTAEGSQAPQPVQHGPSPEEERRIEEAKRLAYYRKLGVGSRIGRR